MIRSANLLAHFPRVVPPVIVCSCGRTFSDRPVDDTTAEELWSWHVSGTLTPPILFPSAHKPSGGPQ